MRWSPPIAWVLAASAIACAHPRQTNPGPEFARMSSQPLAPAGAAVNSTSPGALKAPAPAATPPNPPLAQASPPPPPGDSASAPVIPAPAHSRQPLPQPASAPPPGAIDFASQVQPILAARCRPCHFPGGSMYGRLPFDRPATILELREKLFTRIKNEKDRQTIRGFLAQQTATGTAKPGSK